MWFDASDASSLTLSGSDVTTWNDKSPNANHVTESTNKPSYTATHNGLGAVTFDGSLEQLSMNSPTGLGSLDTLTFHIIATSNSQPGSGGMWTFFAGELAAGDLGWGIARTGGNNLPQSFITSNGSSAQFHSPTSGTLPNDNTVFWMATSYTSDSGLNDSLYIDGGDVTSSHLITQSYASPNVLTLSGTDSGYTRWKGDICEIVASTDITAFSTIETYLKDKWGI